MITDGVAPVWAHGASVAMELDEVFCASSSFDAVVMKLQERSLASALMITPEATRPWFESFLTDVTVDLLCHDQSLADCIAALS